MITVIVPTLNAAARLPACLTSLVPAVADGLVRDVFLADGGSTDETLTIAEAMGAKVVSSARGRAVQMIAGAAAAARGDWLLFLHADTVLEEGWHNAARTFVERPGSRNRAAAFTLAFDDESPQAQRLEAMVAWRCRVFGLPYGDQGLLISRRFYDALGGFRPLALMEDVDIIRRVGKANLTLLRPRAITSADKYRRDGWGRRSRRNLVLLCAWFAGVSDQRLARWYR